MEKNFTISTIQQSDEFIGNISLKGSLDYEKLNKAANGQVTLYVQAKDFGNPSLSSTCTVIINIQDINDNTPVFNPSEYLEHIYENATVGNYVGRVHATDGDGTEANYDFSYYIITGSGLFRINGTSGQITVNLNAEFDRETTEVYNLTIVAVDRGTPPKTGHTNVTVVIDDVNDTPPTFDKGSFFVDVSEDKIPGTSLINCSATDEDSNFNLFYKIFDLQTPPQNTIDNETVKNWFKINSATGEVTINSALDRELTDTVLLTLTVNDTNAATSILQTATATLTVSILDVNDNYPVFLENYPVNITEGKISGPVITVTAHDADKNPKITYRITKNYLTDTFSINPNTGQITRNPLIDVDRENHTTIEIEVEANDTCFTNTTTVIITVLDINDNFPVFDPYNNTINLQENNGTDQNDIYNSYRIIWFNASDADAGPNAELTFKIIDGFHKFHIDSFTGIVTTTGHFDREIKPSYILKVTVNDNPLDENERKTSTATITIKITDINDNNPYFPKEYYIANVREDQKDLNYSIIAVTANDSDINHSFEYSIEPHSNEKRLFRINKHSGSISVNASLKNNYGWTNLTVWVEDVGGLKNSTLVFIYVEDLNDNKPVFHGLKAFYKIYECAKIGSNVTILNATDADYGLNSKVSYTFVNQTGPGKNYRDFLLNNSTGEITTAKNLSADGDYRLRVKAYDHGTPVLSTIEDIEIKIVDVNDHPPTFPHTTENASVLENTQNVTVTTVKAEDIDKDSIIEYKMKQDDSGSFTIDLKDGTIKIINALDRENTTNAMVSLIIEAVDASGTNASDQCYNSIFTQNNSTTTTVNIKILDQNDNPPIFKSSFISIGVRRTITTGKTEAFIYDLKESVEPDPDSEQYSVHQFKVNGKLTYSSGDQLGQKIQELLNTNKIKTCTGSNEKTPICVTGNGTVNTNIQLEENMKGYINIPLIVKDAAGNSTTVLRIYIISDYQTGSILINGNKEYVQSIKADLMKKLTQLTRQNFTADGIRPFNTGTFQSTYLDFHVADPKTGTILSANDAIQLFDKYSSQLGVVLKQYSILAAKTYTETQSQDDEGGIKTTYIMIAVIALLGATNLLIGFFFCSSATRYQRKLKAATTKSTVDQDKGDKETHPGTNVYARNQNPLLNKDADFTNIDYDRFADDASVASYDSNQFTKKEPIRGDEEKGATMDMYDDERDVQQGDNESLAMVLEQYKKEKAASRESLVPRDLHNGHLHTDEFTHSFDNDGLELSLETTEV
ncbi:Hypothetical predicted protein [Mytilus galloprovincialis]|uniref:Cadherin domain-containing protein n=1 Tax=Mytilus galloprovincialis TaxID=29158 RepID=A0A8B6F2N2_MYTGA|nr:Hypothetical predicted protein [Mytilus galloprovincialis]